MKLAIIAAMAENRAIGNDGEIPWHFPEDRKRFKDLTYGSIVIMGRKTRESIGRALPGRINIVVSRRTDLRDMYPDCVVVSSFEAAMAYAEMKSALMTCRTGEVFCIGGAEIYRQAMPYAEKIYLTIIDKNYSGDAFFPEIDMAVWRGIYAAGSGPHHDRGEKFFATFLEFDKSKIDPSLP